MWELLHRGDYVPLGTEHFAEILKAGTAEFKIHHKLKASHLEVTQAT